MKKPKLLTFTNSEGKSVTFPATATIADLLKAGVTRIWLEPEEAPLPTDPSSYTHVPKP